MTTAAKPRAETEKGFQAAIIQLGKHCGWECYFVYDSRHSPPGWVDLVLIKPPRILFIENKTEKGRLSVKQVACLDLLCACGLTAKVWRPSDWPEIEATLKGEM